MAAVYGGRRRPERAGYPSTVRLLDLVLPLLLLPILGCAPASPGPEPTGTPEPTPAPVPEPTPAPTPPPSPVVDLHVDTITAMIDGKLAWPDRRLEASLPELLEGGVDVVVQAAWIPRGDPDPRGTALAKIHRIRKMVQESGGRAALVQGPGQLRAALAEGRLAVVLAIEGGTPLTGGREGLLELRALGVRMVGLTWTESSPFADSSAEPRKGEASGLTEAGRELVGHCNDLGVMLDVSHMSDRATDQTVALSRAPVLASHSNARALVDVPRNLTDAQLDAIAAKGGLVGVMFHGPFVAAGRPASRADVLAQVRYLVDRIGAEHVGIGSDWDGRISSPEGLTGSELLPAFRRELSASSLSEEAQRWVNGASFLRFWDAVEAARAP